MHDADIQSRLSLAIDGARGVLFGSRRFLEVARHGIAGSRYVNAVPAGFAGRCITAQRNDAPANEMHRAGIELKQGVSSRDDDLAVAGNAGRELEKARHESIEKGRRNRDRRLTGEGNKDLAAGAVCR